jgi:hypothetical protein
MKIDLVLLNLRKIVFLSILFIYIYAPPLNFVPFGPNKFLAPIAIFSLLFLFKKSTLKILKQKHIAIAIIFAIASIIYAFVMDSYTILVSDVPVTQKNTYSQVLTLIEVLPIALFLCVYGIRKLKLSFVQLLSSLITIGAIQSLLAVIMLLLPNLRMYILSSVLNYDPKEDKLFRSDLYSFRSFGISQDFFFSLSIVQGIIIVCVLTLCLYSFSKYKYTLLLIPPLLLSIALNARIGFVAIILFVVITLIFAIARLKIYLLSKFLLFTLVSGLTIYFSIANVNILFDVDLEQNLEWASNVFVEGQNFAQGKETDTGNFGQIKKNFLHLPKTASARFFGEGRYVFRNSKSNLDSDVGYVRKIYFGGYIYSFLAYGTLFYLFLGTQNKKYKYKEIFQPLFYCLFLTALVSQLKGDIFLPIPGYRVIFLVFLFAISERRLNKPKNLISDYRFIPWYPHETHKIKS